MKKDKPWIKIPFLCKSIWQKSYTEKILKKWKKD